MTLLVSTVMSDDGSRCSICLWNGIVTEARSRGASGGYIQASGRSLRSDAVNGT